MKTQELKLEDKFRFINPTDEKMKGLWTVIKNDLLGFAAENAMSEQSIAAPYGTELDIEIENTDCWTWELFVTENKKWLDTIYINDCCQTFLVRDLIDGQDGDLYYGCNDYDGNALEHTAVGYFIPLKKYLPERQYNALRHHWRLRFADQVKIL